MSKKKKNYFSNILSKKSDSILVLFQPQDSDKNFEAFEIISTKHNLSNIKNFLNNIITNIDDLNKLKANFEFLIKELYGNNCENTILGDGTMFYVWVYLPYNNTKSNCLGIFKYDFFYVRNSLSSIEIKKIIDFFKNTIQIYTRKLNEIVKLPFDIYIKDSKIIP